MDDEYLWQVARRLSQFRYYPQSRATIEEGVVVVRVTVARDGRLLNVSLAKSSGFPTLDNGIMGTIREASPYPPLPATIRGNQHSFILPITFKHHDAR